MIDYDTYRELADDACAAGEGRLKRNLQRLADAAAEDDSLSVLGDRLDDIAESAGALRAARHAFSACQCDTPQRALLSLSRYPLMDIKGGTDCRRVVSDVEAEAYNNAKRNWVESLAELIWNETRESAKEKQS